MGRLLRLLVIFLALLLAAGLLGLGLGLRQAGPVAAGALFMLLVLGGLLLRGRRPGFTRAEARRLFGAWHG
jgi:hypothetical protein